MMCFFKTPTPAFAGFVLHRTPVDKPHTNETRTVGGAGGVVVWNVTDLTTPSKLASAYDINDFFSGPDFEAFGVHNVYIVSHGASAYVLAVANISPDSYGFRILDVTDPGAPTEVGRWSSTVSPDARIPEKQPTYDDLARTALNERVFAAVRDLCT